MTMNDPENGNGNRFRKWLAQWSAEVMAGILLAMIGYGWVVVMNNQRLTDRMDASEKDRAEIHKMLDDVESIQRLNSEFRESSKARQEADRREMDEIRGLIIQHMQQENQNWHGKQRNNQ